MDRQFPWLMLGDCLERMKEIRDGSVDLVVTSPPYDNLRSYTGYSFEFEKTANQLTRVIKNGGVIVWVVGDATVKGSESGSSFRQALYFKDVCGLNLHDTMIYQKLNQLPLNHNRYEQAFEYMFVLSKGKPLTFNPIKVPCKFAGQPTWGKPKIYKDASGYLTEIDAYVVNEKKIKGNIFEYRVGSTKTGKIKHPAMFPIQLASDQITSWSNPMDIVLDPFMGSGTTGVAALGLERRFIGIEISEAYFQMSQDRINPCIEARQSAASLRPATIVQC